MPRPAPSEANPGKGSDLGQAIELSSPDTPHSPLSRLEFNKIGLTSLGLPGVDKIRGFFNLPRSAEELALLDMSKEARQLIEGVLAGNPEAVTYVLKNMLSVNPDSVQPYQIGRDKEGKEKSLWDFSLVSQIPRWTNSLLSDQAKETFSKRHGQKPKLVQINLNNFRLTPRQAEGLFDLLGGKRKDQLVHDLTKVGLAAAGAALAVKGGIDALEGAAKIVKSKNSSAGKEEVAKGLLEGAVGIEAVNYVMLTDADIYNSLTADQQKALQTVAIALFPPAWVSACLSTNPSLEGSNIPTAKEPTSSPYPSPLPQGLAVNLQNLFLNLLKSQHPHLILLVKRLIILDPSQTFYGKKPVLCQRL